jgi:hypothetical protein
MDYEGDIPLEINAEVEYLFRAGRNSYAMQLQNVHHRTVYKKSIPAETWSTLKLGDQVTKKSMSRYIVRNHEKLLLIHDSPLHKIRGAID